jgi:hypothetical protein
MAAWPAILPQGFLRGFSVKPQDSVLRTQMDVGPDKLRRRVTYSGLDVTGEIICSQAQVEALELFYLETTRSGTTYFTMATPHTDRTYEARFSEPPEVVWRGGNVYQCAIKLEMYDTSSISDNAVWPDGDNMVWGDGDNWIWPSA